MDSGKLGQSELKTTQKGVTILDDITNTCDSWKKSKHEQELEEEDSDRMGDFEGS